MKFKSAAIFSSLLISAALHAQTATPVVVVPANVPAAAPAAQTAAGKPGGTQAVLQTLQQMKATNADLLKKQQATLQQLDALEKAIEQIKIYSHRS